MRTLLCVLLLAPAAAAEPAVSAVKTGDGVEFKVGDEVAAVYRAGPAVAKPYVWPLLAPGGVPVTRAWPMKEGEPQETKDHVHQKSVWFCHGDVIVEGVEPKTKIKHVDGFDFWAELPGHGREVATEIAAPQALDGGKAVRVAGRLDWRSPEGVTLLTEARALTFRALPGGGRLLVFDIDLAAEAGPVVFADTKEGAMGVRVNDQIRLAAGKGRMVSDDGRSGEKAVWGHPAKWVDYSGPVNGTVVGVAVFDDPSNPHPAAWHARGYGLLAANPFGRDKSGFPSQKGKADLVKLAKGEHLKLRYGVFAHAGDAAAGKVAEAYEAFKAAK